MSGKPLIEHVGYHRFLQPGFLGFEGGVFNPGGLPDGDDIILLARGELYTRAAIKDTFEKFYNSCRPILLRLDKDLRLQAFDQPRLDEKLVPNAGRIEDFRLFSFQGRIFVNHPYLIVDPDYALFNSRPTWRHVEIRQVLSRLDVQARSLDYVGRVVVDFEPNAIEKNWVYFEHNGTVHCLYSIDPYVLLRADDWPALRFSTIRRESMDLGIDNEGAFLSLSTNPISYDERHYLVLVHIRNPRAIYIHWAILIDKETLLPVQVSVRPIIKGGNVQRSDRGVVYVQSVIARGDRFVFFFGEGDAHTSYAWVDKTALDAVFKPIRPN